MPPNALRATPVLRTSHALAHPHTRRRAFIGKPSCFQKHSSSITDNAVFGPSSLSASAHQSNCSGKIAVVGGGITGLVTAYTLTRLNPTSDITLYERSSDLGGWMQTSHIDIGTGKVVLEQGPRTLRPAGPAAPLTVALIESLGLGGDVITTSKDSVAAQNRYVYYPDRLVQMPGPGQSILSILSSLFIEPIFKGIFRGPVHDFKTPKRSDDVQDESVGDFFCRRLGAPDLVDNLASAIFHGIYAGDIYKLSMRTLFPVLWEYEKVYGSIFVPMFDVNRHLVPERDQSLEREMKVALSGSDKWNELGKASVYSFRHGITQISRALEDRLRSNPRVDIKVGEAVKQLKYRAGTTSQLGLIELTSSKKSKPISYNRVISTIPSRNTSALAASNSPLISLAKTPSVTVMVVNLYYHQPSLTPVHGFGYLIPRSLSLAENPEFALGVIFDSGASIGQDTAPGTKLTVMLGGHWWDSFDTFPDETEGAAMARSVLRRHLGIVAEPAYVNVGLKRNCIPQYTVGHDLRMRAANMELLSGFGGLLSVAGNSYSGVGINDSVRSAREVAMGVVDAMKGKAASGPWSGLERFERDQKFVLARSAK